MKLLITVIYGLLKRALFPRIEINVWYGAEFTRRRRWLIKALIGFLVVGAFGAIYQSEVLNRWRGSPEYSSGQ